MALVFVSDFHIQDSNDPLYHSLISIMSKELEAGDTFVIGGDLFDFMVGDLDLYRSSFDRFFRELESLEARDVKTHYIEGNHDFHLTQLLADYRVRVWKRDFELHLGGRKFFVAHGDLVDQSDYGYRALRLFFRSPVISTFVKVAPEGLVDKIGKLSSMASQSQPSRKSKSRSQKLGVLREKYHSFSRAKFDEGFDYVIMGHCHDLDEFKQRRSDGSKHYINMGYPREHLRFLKWNPGDEWISRQDLPIV